MEILSNEKRYKEKGIAFRVQLNTSQEDPHKSKITIDLSYDDEIIDFIELFTYEKDGFIKDVEEIKNCLNETLNRTFLNLTQYD